MSDPRPGLRALLEGTAGALGGADRRESGGTLELAAQGTVFAAIDNDRAEFRLGLPIAAAALRTPDTAASERGRDWVAFSPPELDRHAMDRAEAWLASAWRRASAGD